MALYTVAADTPLASDDLIANAPVDVLQPVTDEDYNDFPVPESTTDIIIDDSLIELMMDIDAVARVEAQGTVGALIVRPQKMCVKLGLPADFFVQECDDDFHHWNAMYLPVMCDKVAQHVVHQLRVPEDVDALLDSLMMGANAPCDYPSGYPLPAAVRPIVPPMQSDAKLIFTNQHWVSEAAYQAYELLLSHI
ncbi:hypothetical protein GGI09_003835 [Coemansia sp. S100]|nr:hypothetical protein GGI09_003835 [Coemansia sp. S100]